MENIVQIIKKLEHGEQPTIDELAYHDQIDRYTALEIASGKKVSVTNVLYEICDNVHAQCHDECPVYALMTSEEKKHFSCQHHKNGKGMLEFIHSRTGSAA